MAHTISFRVHLAAGLATAAVVAAILAGTTAAATKAPVRVTFVGDSVPASIMYSPRAKLILARGLATRMGAQSILKLDPASRRFSRFASGFAWETH